MISNLKSESLRIIDSCAERVNAIHVVPRTSSFSLNYSFHSGAQEKEIRAGPRSSYPCGVTPRRSGSTTFPARASMSLFAKHLLAAIARLLNPLVMPRVALGAISLDVLRSTSLQRIEKELSLCEKRRRGKG